MAAPQAETAPPRRITDLQRSAFWIYGVTAMIMRDPLSVIVRQTAELGFGNWEVRLEILRVGVILILLSRLFLVSGLYFEQVYMQPESGDRYPRRSYAVDFLAGLAQFLVATAASTAIALQSVRTLTPFALLVAVFLAVDWLWLGLAALRRFSSLRRSPARPNPMPGCWAPAPWRWWWPTRSVAMRFSTTRRLFPWSPYSPSWTSRSRLGATTS